MNGQSGIGPKCARHAERPATATCERCGNFTCDECNLGQSETLCPACHELVGPGGFPFTRDRWSFDGIWSYAWEAFKRDWVMLSVAVLLFLGIAFLVGMVGGVLQAPFKGNLVGMVVITIATQLGSIVAQGIFEMGLMRIALDVLQGEKANLGRITSQMPKLGRFFLQRLLVLLAFLAPPGLIGLLFVTMGGASESTLGPIAIVILLVLLVPAVYFALPLVFATAELVYHEDAGPISSLRNCYAIASGQRLPILGFALLVVLISVAGVIACCVGVLPAIALAQLLIGGLYLALRNGSGLPLRKS